MEAVWETAWRTLLSFLWLLLLARLLGKRQLSQLSFFDYVTGISIGSLAAGLSLNLEQPFYIGFSALGIWALASVLTSYLSLKNRRLRALIDGEPTILVKDGEIFEENLRRLRYDVDDLRTELRLRGAFSIEDVEYAVLEPSGKLSVKKRAEAETPTREDVHIHSESPGLPVELVVDGEVIHENFISRGVKLQDFLDVMARRGVRRIDDIVLATIDEKDRIHLDLRNPRYEG